MEEASSHWSGKPFYVAWTTSNVWKATARGLAIFRGLGHASPSYCVKYNQHAKHGNARESGSMPSPRKTLKLDVIRLNLGPFQGQAS